MLVKNEKNTITMNKVATITNTTTDKPIKTPNIVTILFIALSETGKAGRRCPTRVNDSYDAYKSRLLDQHTAIATRAE